MDSYAIISTLSWHLMGYNWDMMGYIYIYIHTYIHTYIQALISWNRKRLLVIKHGWEIYSYVHGTKSVEVHGHGETPRSSSISNDGSFHSTKKAIHCWVAPWLWKAPYVWQYCIVLCWIVDSTDWNLYGCQYYMNFCMYLSSNLPSPPWLSLPWVGDWTDTFLLDPWEKRILMVYLILENIKFRKAFGLNGEDASKMDAASNDQIQKRWLVGKLTDSYGDHERSKYGEPLGLNISTFVLSLSLSVYLFRSPSLRHIRIYL